MHWPPPARTVGKDEPGREWGREDVVSHGDTAECNKGAAEGGAHALWAPGSHRVPAATGPPEEPALDSGSGLQHGQRLPAVLEMLG